MEEYEKQNSLLFEKAKSDLVKKLSSLKKIFIGLKIFEVIVAALIIFWFVWRLTHHQDIKQWFIAAGGFFMYKIILYGSIYSELNQISQKFNIVLEHNQYFPIMVKKIKRYLFITKKTWNYFLTSLNNESLWKQNPITKQ